MMIHDRLGGGFKLKYFYIFTIFTPYLGEEDFQFDYIFIYFSDGVVVQPPISRKKYHR